MGDAGGGAIGGNGGGLSTLGMKKRTLQNSPYSDILANELGVQLVQIKHRGLPHNGGIDGGELGGSAGGIGGCGGGEKGGLGGLGEAIPQQAGQFARANAKLSSVPIA